MAKHMITSSKRTVTVDEEGGIDPEHVWITITWNNGIEFKANTTRDNARRAWTVAYIEHMVDLEAMHRAKTCGVCLCLNSTYCTCTEPTDEEMAQA